MSRSAADIAALYTELTTDPNSLGLVAPPTIDDVGNSEKLNEVLEAQQVDRQAIPSSEIARQIKRSEFANAAPADQSWLLMQMQTGTVNTNDSGKVKAGLLEIFAAGSDTRAGMATLLTEAVNRIEQMYRQGLLEAGGYVTPSDIAAARQYTP